VIPQWVWWAIWFWFGSCVGSFLNVCIWRMPREQSVVRPRSRCTHCERQIAWYDNIPLLSFLWLGARCRHCRAPIAWRYPLVEALTGATTVVVLHRFGDGPVGWIYVAFACGLIASSFIDLDFRIIPDEISVGGLVFGLIGSALVPALHATDSRWLSLQRSFAGVLIGGGLLYGTGTVGNLMLFALRRLGIAARRRPFWRHKLARYRGMRESMGGGDVKLMAMAGSILGWKPVTLAFFLAPFLALGPGIVTMLTQRSHYIPYGPFLSLALIAALFFGQQILAWSGIEDMVKLLWEFYGPR